MRNEKRTITKGERCERKRSRETKGEKKKILTSCTPYSKEPQARDGQRRNYLLESHDTNIMLVRRIDRTRKPPLRKKAKHVHNVRRIDGQRRPGSDVDEVSEESSVQLDVVAYRPDTGSSQSKMYTVDQEAVGKKQKKKEEEKKREDAKHQRTLKPTGKLSLSTVDLP